MTRVATDITVAAGCFDSQPLVFAHLWDQAPELDLSRVEVLQGTTIRRRLEHYFPPQTVTHLLIELDLDDTLVLFLQPMPEVSSPQLRSLGIHAGTVPRP